MKSVYALLLFCGLSFFSVAQDCLQLTATEAFGVTGATVCVDFSANNFENVLTVQHTIEWDPLVLEFIEIIPSSNLPDLNPTNFGTLLTAQGLITYSWLDPNAGSGVTLPDGTPHYTICFEVIGTAGSQSAVRFTETNTAYEISQDDPPGFLFPEFNHIDGAFHFGNTPTNLSITDGCGINSDCGGGQSSQIDISVSGGQPPYNFVWETNGTIVGNTEDLIGIPEGYYTVTVTDAGGQEVTGGFTVGASVAALILDITAFNTSCPGNADGSISVQVLSGQPPYVFAWSNGSTQQNPNGLAAGLYQVTVSDASGCGNIETIQIVDSPGLLVDGIVTHPTCGQNDGSIDLFISGGTPPYNFTWSTGGSGSPLNNLGKGQYEVTVTDFNGCSTLKTFYLNEIGGNGPTELIINCVPGTDTGLIIMAFNDPTLTNPPFTYTWSDGFVYVDNNPSVGTSGCARTDLPNGNYSVMITDAGGCMYQSPTYTINCTPGPEVCLQLHVQDAEVNLPNLSFCVDITADDLFDVKAMQLAFDYDPNLLTFTGIQNADPLEANGSVVNLSEPVPGTIHV
ncbi:MAG: hypothetical protein KDC44_07335, partial [Phaeodactylibacter sp.]|nr:hypothetical protein [Phaeodactylibacter sp.]